MEKRWFLLKSGVVSGPMSENEINANIQSPQDDLLIWGRGQHEWVPPIKWKKFLEALEEDQDKTKIISERMWKIRNGQTELKPMSQSQMIQFLKDQKDLSQYYIWTDGYDEWKEVFAVEKILDEIGVSRRAHPRVPIMGTITCEAPTGVVIQGRALTISEGGLGMSDAKGARIGDKYKLILKSPNLYTPIHATGEVVFIDHEGYVGLKFNGLHSESRGAIIEYVKKFSELKKGL